MNLWFAGRAKDKVNLTLKVSKTLNRKSTTHQHIHDEVHRSTLSLPKFME